MVFPFRHDYSRGVNDPSLNPWITYDGNMVDGYYDQRLDRDIWENNGQAESSRARVWRWTLDDLRASGVTNPGAADPAAVRAAYLRNVARLRRDIEAPENAARGLTWGSSGFAGYDKYLSPESVVPGSGGPGRGRASNNPPSGGRPTTPVPPTTSQVPPGAETRPPFPETTPTPPVAPPALPGLPPYNPGINGGLGSYSGVNPQNDAFQRDYLASDPEMAYEYMTRQLGMNPDITTRFSRFMEQRFSPLLQSSLAASSIGDNANYKDVVDQLIANFGQAASTPGGTFFGDLRRQADQALQSEEGMGFLSGIADQDAVQQYLNQLAVARYAGSNPMVQQSIADQLEAAQRGFNWEDFQSSGQVGKYLDWLRKSRYAPYLPTR